jgi:polyisoprenoid-binding protein YceI
MTSWIIDERHSGIHFKVRHLMVGRVHGQFRRFSVDLAIDEAELARSTIAVDVDVASVDTGNPARDQELRGARFFVADQFPAMTFRSRRVEARGEKCQVTGNLTIRGVTREVVLDAELAGFVKDPWGKRRAGFTACGSLLRSQFGMEWNQLLEAGGVVVGDRIDLEIEIEATEAQAQRAAAV